MPYFMYVTISEENKIQKYSLDPSSGDLRLADEVPVPGRPAPLATDPSNRYLFVGRRDDNQLSSYSISPGDGRLELLGTVPLENDPCYLSTDRQGHFLLSAYYEGGLAAVHAIEEGGLLSPTPVEWRPTGRGAHSMQTDLTNRFAFVPHIAGGTGPNTIFQFRFDAQTGHLTPNDPPQLFPGDEAGPRHYCFHPKQDVVYFSNEQGCSVTGYHLDSASGTLSPFQTISTLPDGYDGRNSCAQIQISPNGKFLYAPNRGHNSIACFAVSETTGELSSIGHMLTEPVPRAITVDPQGRFLYAAGLDSGRLAAYRIDQDSGGLTHLNTYDAGKAPMWMLIVATDS